MITIQTAAGDMIGVDEMMQYQGFQGGDIFFDINEDSVWYNKVCCLAGCDTDKGLWFKPVNSDIGYKCCSGNAEWVLLERPGLRFKVNDCVLLSNIGQAKIIMIDPYTGQYYVTNPVIKSVDGSIDFSSAQWCPLEYKSNEPNGKWYSEAELLKLESEAKEKKPAVEKAEKAEKPVLIDFCEPKCAVSAWFKQLSLQFKAKVAHLFILWGNIYDIQRNMRGEYLSLRQYLAEAFMQRDLIMFYSISSGLQFANDDMERLFRFRILGKPKNNPEQTEAQKAASDLQENQSMGAPLSLYIGDTPDKAFRSLEKILIDSKENSLSVVLIVDFAHNIAPNQVVNNGQGERIATEVLERWAKDERIKEAGNTVVLITPSLASLAEGLRSPQGEAVAIRIPKPNEEERTERWEYNKSLNGVLFKNGLTSEHLGRITSGLSYKQIDAIYRLAKEQKIPISLSLVKEKKQESLETEFGDRIKVKTPKWGFDYFGGKDYLKRYGREINENILSGMWRRLPMGILASGPPGTGKTFFFECLAYECGFNFVEIANPRSMWLGQSEEIAEKIFATLDDLAPVIVIEDEADQSETPRDTPNGDSGVSNRLRQMKFKFTSDPARRGKVIWVRISNRPDLIDTAYKREGRSDDTIPFLIPNADEYADIFKVMFARYEIPTSIKDFMDFSAEVATKKYCTGASLEWMVLEADKYAGREGADCVDDKHLEQALSDWEMKISPQEIDRQTILAIEGSSKRLRPNNWETILGEARLRLYGEQETMQSPIVFPGLNKLKTSV